MTFLSPTFMFIFLPIALGIYSIIPQKRRIGFLPVIGIVFFVCANISDHFAVFYVSLIVAAVSVIMVIYKKTRSKKLLSISAAVFLAVCFAMLIVKTGEPYSGFRGAGLIMCLMSSVSLFLDVARGEGRVPRTPWEGITYVTYFPTMTAGPFVSYEDFLLRLECREWSAKCFSKGAMLFLKGFVKAVFIGAVLGSAFNNMLALGFEAMGVAVAFLLAVVQFLALYAFFSGYSDMARGISFMIGIELESDMGNPFLNHTPADYLRGFFKGFTVFFKKCIASPIIRFMGETLISRIIASILSSAFLLLLFCQNGTVLLVLIPVVSVAEYFVLFGRSSKLRSPVYKRIIGTVITFVLVSLAWAAVAMTELGGAADSLKVIFSNGFFYLSPKGAAQLTNLRHPIIPLLGCLVSVLASFILANEERSDDWIGFSIIKYITAALLIAAFAIGVIMLLPQFPGLASDVFGANFV